MCEEIISTVEKYMKEQIKISKGFALLLLVCSFLVGIAVGSACGSGCTRKKLEKKNTGCGCGSDESFDADEYVKSLNFEDD